MTTLVESRGGFKKPWLWVAIGSGILLIWAAMAIPKLRSNGTEKTSQAIRTEPMSDYYSSAWPQAPSAPQAQKAVKTAAIQAQSRPDAVAGRKIIRTVSLEMIVQHPAEVADSITALAERMGGYLVSSDRGGQNATAATLTIRVPATRFEEARAEIRKLGLRVENEKINAQDVTRQYVDQDANLRNLHAEESQYLAILKQAGTVKDMLAVSEKLSEVRGQIEQEQAEFNALSQQIETVALTISLRTEAEAQVLGLNWRPGYQLKLALRDGLESLATYAAAMTSLLFYLPAVLLWAGTIVFGTWVAWCTARWAGRRWFGWKAEGTRAKC